jgi:protease stability complex PrcB-like protein
VSKHVHVWAGRPTDLTSRGCGRSLRAGRTRAAIRVHRFWGLLALVVFGMTPSCKPTVQMASLPHELIVQDTGMKQAGSEPQAPPSYRLFHDAGAFESYWQSTYGSAPPPVDFAREFVLCVHQGTKPTGGYAIAAREVQFDAAQRRLDCTLELTEPAPDAMLIQALTSPYAIYRVSLPTGQPLPATKVEIRFQREQAGGKVPVQLQRMQ